MDNVPRSVADRLRASPLPTWTVFWADGRRTLDVIAVLAAGELGRPVTTAQLGSFCETLAELGYVDLVDSSCVVRREELEADLRRLGLAAGMDLMIHSSLSALGHVEGGPETVIDALTAVLGAEGTLLMPSFHHGAARVYNPLTTPTVNGAIPEAFWRLPGVLRSDHPTHAVAARGPRAAEYLRDHRRHGIWAAESPIGRLVHGGGYVLSLGVGHESTTAYHVAEIAVPCGCLDMFGSDDLVVDAGVVTAVPGLAWRERACPVPLARMAERLAGRQRSGRVGRAEALLTPASEVWRARHVDLVRVCPSCPIRPHPRTAAVRR